MDKQSNSNGNSDGDEPAVANKRPRLCVEPDVTVVVGGREFQHHGLMLCSLSEYFRAALSSPMKEASEHRVELVGMSSSQQEDAQVWPEVAKFFDATLAHSPTGGATVTEDNVLQLLPWFHYLQMPNLLQTCERCLREMTLRDGNICRRRAKVMASAAEGDSAAAGGGAQMVVPVGGFSTAQPDLARLQAELSLLCDSFSVCLRYGLDNLKNDIQEHLVQAIYESPDFFTLDSLRTLTAALAATNDRETVLTIWDALKVYVPAEAHPNLAANESTDNDDDNDNNDELDALVRSPLLPHLIHSRMWQSTLAKRERRLPRVLTEQWIFAGHDDDEDDTDHEIDDHDHPRHHHGALDQRTVQTTIRDYFRCFPISMSLDHQSPDEDGGDGAA